MTEEQFKHRRWIRFGIVAILGLLACGSLYVVRTNHPSTFSFFPKCQLNVVTGLHCPGCGLTRSVHALLNGQVRQSLAYNILWPIVLPLLTVSLTRSLWLWAWGAKRSGKVAQPNIWIRWIPLLIGGILIVYSVARNIPYHPFTLLAPHELATSATEVPE
jgi:hypothetical protein